MLPTMQGPRWRSTSRSLIFCSGTDGATLPADGVTTRDRPYAEKIILHLKPQPFYVSDAMPKDVERT